VDEARRSKNIVRGRLAAYIGFSVLIFGFLLGFSYLVDDVGAVGSVRGYLWLPVYIIWLPGSILAAIIFPTGIHSDSGLAYIWLSMLIDALLWPWPMMRTVEYMGKTLRRTVRGDSK
jgi:hypothetical protein